MGTNPVPLDLPSLSLAPENPHNNALGRLFCLDCSADLTPTPNNGLGWLYCVLAKHQLRVVKPISGLERMVSLVDQILVARGVPVVVEVPVAAGFPGVA